MLSRAGEMAQLLRAVTLIADDLSSAPSTHMEDSQSCFNTGDLILTSGFLGIRPTIVHTLTCKENMQIHMIKQITT